MGKKWWKSKTYFVNALTAAANMALVFGFDTGLTNAEVGIVATGSFLVVNAIIRLFTNEPIERSLL